MTNQEAIRYINRGANCCVSLFGRAAALYGSMGFKKY